MAVRRRAMFVLCREDAAIAPPAIATVVIPPPTTATLQCEPKPVAAWTAVLVLPTMTLSDFHDALLPKPVELSVTQHALTG